MAGSPCYIGIDIGAGLGAKFALFDESRTMLANHFVSKDEYGESAESMTAALARGIDIFQRQHASRRAPIRALGIASPGLFSSDGSCLLANNLPYLNRRNLPAMLHEQTGLPVGIENDANAGGLAEWSVLQVELIYWVFGGGWGGAWISEQGEVCFPAVNWDGNDASLHYSNEPGYAIPLDKLRLKIVFSQMGVSYDWFEQILLEELKPADGKLRGPNGSLAHLRSEHILSGPGRCRLFRAAVGDDDSYKRYLESHEVEQIHDYSVAGKHISKLSSLRVEAAVTTDRLFGKILAQATRLLLRQARQDGCREGVPICLGGKPSYALPYFGPSAQRAIGAMGLMNYLRPSIIDERGSNANLVGACVVAEKAARAWKR